MKTIITTCLLLGVVTAQVPSPAEQQYQEAYWAEVGEGDLATALRAAGLRDQPIFCAQNGVANERAALRLFPNVHGITVMMPAAATAPAPMILM